MTTTVSNIPEMRPSGQPARCSAVVVVAIVLALLSGCESRFKRFSGTQLPPSIGVPPLHPAVIVNGDELEIGFFLRPARTPDHYHIEVGDTLSVSVSEHPELNVDNILVLPDGEVSLPLIGSVIAAGRTVNQIAEVAARAYRRERLRDPKVVFAVVQGQRRLREFMGTLEGGQQGSMLRREVFDEHPVDLPLIGEVAVGRPLADIRADIVDRYRKVFGEQLSVSVNLVARATPLLYVLGEVNQPGSQPMQRGINLLSAIAAAGGFVDTADEASVLVVRFSPGGNYSHWVFDVRDGLPAAQNAGGFNLRPNDVVYVARSPIADANVFIRQYIRGLLPFDIGVGLSIPLSGSN